VLKFKKGRTATNCLQKPPQNISISSYPSGCHADLSPIVKRLWIFRLYGTIQISF